jgi:hypothetical protein
MKQLSPFVSLSASVCLLPFLFLTTSSETNQPSAKSGRALVYIGTYTGPKSNGIISTSWISRSSLTSLGLARGHKSKLFGHSSESPLSLCGHETSNFGGKKGGAVKPLPYRDWEADALESGTFRWGRAMLPGGDKTKDVLVANYDSGSVSVLPIQPDESLVRLQHLFSTRDLARPPAAEGLMPIRSMWMQRIVCLRGGSADSPGVRFDPAKGTLSPTTHPRFQSNPEPGRAILRFIPEATMPLSLTRWAPR